MHILKMGGRLSVHSVVQLTIIEFSIMVDIWILNDSATGLWVNTQSVSVHDINTRGMRDEKVAAVGVEYGGLLLHFMPTCDPFACQGICACNLELGTIRTVDRA